MAHPGTREVVLLGLATITTSGTGVDINVPQDYAGAIITLDVLTVSGTTPTLNVFVQNKMTLPAAADTAGIMPTGSGYYDDLLAFGTATTSTTRFVARLVSGGNTVSAAHNGTLTAASVATGPLGGMWNVKYTAGGTNPSFAFQVVAQLIPFA
jgi:hypothetical protein